MNEYWCSAELISEKHYLEFAFPYEQRVIRAMRDEGLVAVMEFLGSVEPRLPHIAKLWELRKRVEALTEIASLRSQ